MVAADVIVDIVAQTSRVCWDHVQVGEVGIGPAVVVQFRLPGPEDPAVRLLVVLLLGREPVSEERLVVAIVAIVRD